MKVLLACFITLLISSCSQTSSVVRKTSKVNFVTQKSGKIFFKKHITKKMTFRKIASVQNLNSKDSYFLSLYSQFYKINKLVSVNDSLGPCPQFHSKLLSFNVESNEQASLDKVNYAKVKENQDELVSLNVLGLNYRGADLYSYLENRNKWNKADRYVKKALMFHNKNNKKELQLLCETGRSDGLYAFQNMVSYYSQKDFSYSTKSMPAVAKIPVVTNMIILSTYLSRINSYEKEVLKQLNIGWMYNYLDELQKDSENKGYYISKR
ncbi:MAG: hypothetical protein N4A33_03200 [Bacteriovoracaceae bacterium]|jgi:hypothetical protein|nr:hypothetical protein [Bacteriovoracaceae bacterium]